MVSLSLTFHPPSPIYLSSSTLNDTKRGGWKSCAPCVPLIHSGSLSDLRRHGRARRWKHHWPLWEHSVHELADMQARMCWSVLHAYLVVIYRYIYVSCFPVTHLHLSQHILNRSSYFIIFHSIVSNRIDQHDISPLPSPFSTPLSLPNTHQVEAPSPSHEPWGSAHRVEDWVQKHGGTAHRYSAAPHHLTDFVSALRAGVLQCSPFYFMLCLRLSDLIQLFCVV